MATTTQNDSTVPVTLVKTKFTLPTVGRLLKILNNIVTPYAHVTKFQKQVITWSWVVLTLIGWYFNKIPFFPSMTSVFDELIVLKDTMNLIPEIGTSLWLCFVSLFFGTLLSAIITYVSPIALFRPIAITVTKFRYLSITGLSFFFTLTFSSDNLKVYLLMFSISVFFTTSFISAIKLNEADYFKSRSLGLSKWETLLEEVIIGKRHVLIEIMAQTFAILWMMLPSVEVLVRSQGGIATVLASEVKYLHINGIVGIIIIIVGLGIGIDALFGVLRLLVAPYTKYENK